MNTHSFQDQFFSQPMYQQFNRIVTQFESDENEPAVVKYLRANSQM